MSCGNRPVRHHVGNVSLVGGRLTVTGSHTPGSLFPVGETLVQYTATDAARNSRTCNLTITVQGTVRPFLIVCYCSNPVSPGDLYIVNGVVLLCSGTTCDQPYVPVNGEFICFEEEEGVNCTLRCKDGYSLTQDAVHSYFCSYNGVWEPPYSPERPDCSGERHI